MMIFFYINNQQFAPHYQNITIVKKLQNCFDEMYLGGKKTIYSNELFIITNIRIDCQMGADDFEGLLYTILSENHLKNQRVRLK